MANESNDVSVKASPTPQDLVQALNAAYQQREQQCGEALAALLKERNCVLDIRVTESSLTGRREYLIVPVAKERTER